MKTILLTITALFLYFSAYTQSVSADKLIGEWTVKSTELIADLQLQGEQAKQMELFRKGFTGSTFVFKADKSFQLNFPKEAPVFMQQFDIPADTQWKYNAQKGLISVGTEQDHYNLMGIYVKNQGGKIYFLLDESPFLVEVMKK